MLGCSVMRRGQRAFISTSVCILLVYALNPLFSQAHGQQAKETPDALVKRISLDLLDAVKADKHIHFGTQGELLDLVEAKFLPYVDFQRMTSLAAGRFWRDASPDQQHTLTNEFRTQVVYTYAATIWEMRDQKVVFKPMPPGESGPDDAVVRSQVMMTHGQPMEMDYRLESLPEGWRIYDFQILGKWVVESYKESFASEINKGGIDGLIKSLAEKNKKLAVGVGKISK
jgi:phospholipid transport system substrate-binding protein